MTPSEGSYRVMPRPCLGDSTLLLRAIGPQDIEPVRQWRNAQMDVLRQTEPISPEAQVRYFAEHVWPDQDSPQPRQILLAIERHGELIGYGGLVHISWPYRRAEVSFLLAPHLEQDPESLSSLFSRFLVLVQEFAFADLGLRRLTTETYAHRSVHIGAMELAGHRLEGVLREHVLVDGKPTDALVHGILSQDWRRRTARGRGHVLLTSASRKAPLVRALRQACLRLKSEARVIAGDLDPLSPARLESDDFWQMPRLGEDVLDELIAGCRARGISVVLPSRDGELEFWARHREAFAAAGIEVVVSTPEAIARCRDKLAFARFGDEHGLPMIPAAETPQPFGDEPLVVKERFGAGSRGLGLNLTRLQALDHARMLESPVYQPFVAGPEISIDGWVDRHGRVAGVVLRRRDRVVSGESQVTTTFRDAALEEQAVRVLAALQLRGPVVLQAIVVDGGLRVIECNPRFGGASTASIAVGLDSLYWSLAEALGDTDPPFFNRSPGEIRQIRMPVDRVVHGSDL